MLCVYVYVYVCIHDMLTQLTALLQVKEEALITKCPPGFDKPGLEVHKSPHKGDFCRNKKHDKLNIGWVCPIGCHGQTAAPYCATSETDQSPCRGSKPDAYKAALKKLGKTYDYFTRLQSQQEPEFDEDLPHD